MRPRGALRSLLAGLAIALVLPAAGAVPGAALIPEAPADPGVIVQPPAPPVGQPGDPPKGAPLPPRQEEPTDPGPGFAREVSGSLADKVVVASLAALAAAGVGLVGFALVSRYISPAEALKNPQRAMLYGFVRGNPGVHLKRLGEEFHMKTSSILWHVRKLECAELVRSERANGFRVFYPTAGGVEVRNVSRAVTALQNPNAHAIFQALDPAIAATAARLADRLGLHGGTTRWHLKKLKEFGLVEEVPGPEGARYLPTPLGRKAFDSLSSPGPRPAAAARAAPAA